MAKLTVIVPKNATRHWHINVAQKLSQQGHDIEIFLGRSEKQSFFLRPILWLDRRMFRVSKENCFKSQAFDPKLFAIVEKLPEDRLILDLTGDADDLPTDALQFVISPHNVFSALTGAIAAGDLPNFSMKYKGQTIAEGKPMIDNRVSLSRGLQDVLDRAVSFITATTDKVLTDNMPALTREIEAETTFKIPASTHPFFFSFITKALPRLGSEVLRRKKYRSAHWQVGYRFLKGEGTAETKNLSGEKWSVLPDDGRHFYADPFPFTHKDKSYIFVEDWCHKQKKAVISVSKIGGDGVAAAPIPIIEEPWHLSYPQVFSYENDIWMMPESSSARNLVLYRAENFPEKWVKHKVLIEDRDLSDATLLEHEGKFWLFATDGDEGGSRSDMLVVFGADQLEGPWTAHKANPIMIDRAGARPGGAFIKTEGKVFLPIQDGTLGYGGGLGLSELTQLNSQSVSLSPALPIRNKSEWPYPQIHTLNRFGTLEVIDGIAAVKI